MSYVDTSGDCWVWIGTKNPRGYGRFYSKPEMKTRYTHRMMFESVYGFSPEEILHSCDNPSCVKPTHLNSGTHVDNMRDMAAKARGNTVKLTVSDVHDIRQSYIPGRNGNSGELQKRYNVSKSTIRQVANRETWKEVR